MTKVGTIRELWRYPVKSTRGEQLQSCKVGDKGLAGDRAWAIKDESVSEVRGGRHLPRLLQCSSRYPGDAETEPAPAAMIRLPDGTEVASDDPEVNAILSGWMKKPVSVWPIQPEENTEHYRRLPMTEAGLMQEFGREPGEPLPDLTKMPQILMQYISVPGTYFDVTPVQLLTTGSLKYLGKLNPDADWAVARFRPNIVVDTGDVAELVEMAWVGRTINLGEVQLQCFAPSPRCAITMHEQGEDLPKDPSMLRTIVKHADQNLGVYCMVKTGGTIHAGDAVSIS